MDKVLAEIDTELKEWNMNTPNHIVEKAAQRAVEGVSIETNPG